MSGTVTEAWTDFLSSVALTLVLDGDFVRLRAEITVKNRNMDGMMMVGFISLFDSLVCMVIFASLVIIARAPITK